MALLVRWRPAIDRLLLATALGAPAAIAVYTLVAHGGDWPAQRFWVIYTAPLLAFGPIWARQRLATLQQLSPVAVVDALAFVAGAARMAGGWGVLPYSGHTLFLTYAILATPERGLRFTALVLLGVTTWFKLALWGDPWSWGLGLAAGAGLALVVSSEPIRRVHRQERRRNDEDFTTETPRHGGYPDRQAPLRAPVPPW